MLLGLRASGPMRLGGPSCGASLAPIAIGWRLRGILPPTYTPSRIVCAHAAKRGRPRKTDEPAPEIAESEEPEAPAEDPAAPRRGRRSKKEKAQEEARDLLQSQQVDLEVLEEFKARAAAEDEARKAAIGGGEDDPRRLNFHRSLLAASARGLTAECSRIIDSMIDAGLQPGARAIHVWAYSHIVVGDGRAARRVAEEAKQTFGVEWIPETYVALMHGALSCNGGAPDLMAALQMWVAQQDAAAAGRNANPQLGFVFLAKELFRLRYSALAMQVVSEGYAACFKPDDKLAALVIEQLCKQGLQAEAAAEMQRLLDAGLPVGPEQYDTLVRLEAARGSVEGARSMLQNFYTDARFSPPRASTYNALLKGLASGLRLAPLGGAFPAAALAGDEDGLDADEEAAAAGGRRLVLDGDSLDKLLVVLREEMVARGLRPGKETYAAMVESFAAVGDLDGALSAYDTLLRANGSPALLRKKYLGRLVVGLLVSDRPIDALRVLRDCSESSSFDDARESVTLPPAASDALPGPAGGGRTALTVWLQAHYETMRQRRGQRASVLQFMQDADMSSRREVDGVVLGLGGCVVTADGLFVPPSRMTTAELRAELSGAGIEVPASATGGSSSSTRSQLLKLVKDRRTKLPSGLIEMQAQLAAQLEAREEAELRAARKAAALASREESGGDDDFLWDDEAEEDEMEDDDDDDGPTGLDPNVASIIADEGTFEGGDSIEDSPTFFAAARGRLAATGEMQERDSLRVRGAAEAAEAEEEAEEEAEAEDEEELEDEYEYDDVDVDVDDDDEDLPLIRLDDLDEDEDEEEDEEEEDDADDMLESVDMISGPGLDAAAAAARNKRRRKRRVSDDDDDDYDEEDDELAELGLDDDAPLSDGLGPIPGANRRGREFIQMQKVDDDEAILDQVLAMSTFDASRFNEAAGMVVALRMLGLWAAVGGVPSAADFLALYEGAVVEAHPRCAADLAEQLPVLEAGGDVSSEQLTEMMVTLANICLSPAKADAEAADRIITAMEDAGLPVPPGLYSGLAAALGGRKRTRESVLGRSGHEVAAVEWEAAGNMANVTLDADVEDIRGAEQGEGEAGATASTDEAEEGEEEEGEEELFAGYEEDPASQEAEELEWLFQRDAEEDDSWMDDLDTRPADVEEVRAEAEAKAAAARQEAAVANALERVRLVAGPAAAALLAQTIEQRDAARLEEAAKEAAVASDTAAEERVDLLSSLETALVESGTVTVLPTVAAPQAWQAGGAGSGSGDGARAEEAQADAELQDLTAEVEWQAKSMLELPPVVLAEAANAALAEMRAAGVVDEDDAAALQRIADKATVLEQLRAVSTAAAAAHPGGMDAAAEDVEAALGKLQAAEAAAMSYAAAVGLDAAAAGEDLAAAAREAAGWGEDEVLDFLDEIDETRGEMDEAEAAEMLTEEDLEPAVDHETALTGVAGELAEEAVRQAEALLELEAEGGINTGDGDTPDEEDERLLSEAERGYRAALVLGLEDAEAQQAALQRAYQGAEAALKAGKKPKWSKEQQAVAAALDAGDMGALQERLGLEGVEWIAGELRALAEREEMELPADVDEADEDEVPVLPGGLALSERFMEAVRATVADRAAAAEAEGVPPAEVLGGELAVLDAMLALANGYRPQGFEGESVSDLAGANEDGEDGSELGRLLQQLRRDASDAMAAADAAVGTAREEQAFAAAASVVSELMEVASEVYEEAEEAAAEAEEAMGEYEEGEELSEEDEAASREAARQMLAALAALQPNAGLPFGADGAGAEEEQGGAATAVAAPPAPAPPKAGRKGRGTRGTASSE